MKNNEEKRGRKGWNIWQKRSKRGETTFFFFVPLSSLHFRVRFHENLFLPPLFYTTILSKDVSFLLQRTRKNWPKIGNIFDIFWRQDQWLFCTQTESSWDIFRYMRHVQNISFSLYNIHIGTHNMHSISHIMSRQGMTCSIVIFQTCPTTKMSSVFSLFLINKKDLIPIYLQYKLNPYLLFPAIVYLRLFFLKWSIKRHECDRWGF